MPWGFAGAVATGAASYLSTKYAADRQLEATRETNRQNYKIWQEEQQHNIDMYNLEKEGNYDTWLKQQEYNDPSAVRKRWEDAGFNPYLAMQGSQAGFASSQPVAPKVNPSHAPTMQMPSDQAFKSPFGQALQDGLAVLNGVIQQKMANKQSKKIDAEVEKLGEEVDILKIEKEIRRLEKEFANETQQDRRDALREEINLKRGQARSALSQAKVDEKTEEVRAKYHNLLVDQAEAQIASIRLDNETKQKLNKYMDAQQQMDLALKYQQYLNLVDEGLLTKQQLRNRIADEILTYEKINTEKSQQAKNNADANLSTAQKGLVEQQTATEKEKTGITAQERKNAEALADDYVNAMESVYKAQESDAIVKKRESDLWISKPNFSKLRIGWNAIGDMVNPFGVFVPKK